MLKIKHLLKSTTAIVLLHKVGAIKIAFVSRGEGIRRAVEKNAVMEELKSMRIEGEAS